MSDERAQLREQLTTALAAGTDTATLVAMRLAVRELPVHEVHNALSGALEDVAAAKFADDVTRPDQ